MKTLDTDHTRQQVIDILSNVTGEFSWLDFKLEFTGNTEELLHDIICLSNARHSGTRYLVYGVKNSTWDLKGITKDLVSHDIYTVVNGRVWNHKPVILVENFEYSGLRFGYIAVADSPTKPHFLRTAYKNIAAGSVHTRQGDVNTSYKKGSELKSVEDGELEAMFRERFGLDKPLLEKLEILLSQSAKWEEFSENSYRGYFHEDFPEYQIRFTESDLTDEESSEPWVDLHPKQVRLVQKDSEYSRVQRNTSLFGWGKEYSVYIHSTPVFQDGALIRLYKTYCPYPNLLIIENRHLIETNISENRISRITYYVGAISCLRSRTWIHHSASSSDPEGDELFSTYNAVIRSAIDRSRSDSSKEPILLLDVDKV
jgi:hypothetical protein